MERSEIKEKVKEIWCKVLGIDQIEKDNNFFDLGGDSLLGVEVICELEEAFNIEINQADYILEVVTFKDCTDYVEKSIAKIK